MRYYWYINHISIDCHRLTEIPTSQFPGLAKCCTSSNLLAFPNVHVRVQDVAMSFLKTFIFGGNLGIFWAFLGHFLESARREKAKCFTAPPSTLCISWDRSGHRWRFEDLRRCTALTDHDHPGERVLKKSRKNLEPSLFHYISSYFNVWNETFWGSETPKLVFFWRLRSLAMQQSAFLNKHLSSFGGPE